MNILLSLEKPGLNSTSSPITHTHALSSTQTHTLTLGRAKNQNAIKYFTDKNKVK